MKKTFFLTLIILMILGSRSQAQVTLDCESGNRAIEQGNCWVFGATSYSNLATRITGNWSLRSNQLTNPAITATWVKTPWIKPGSGNITLKARLDNATGTTRGIVFSYIAYDPDAATSYKEGQPVTYHTFSWSAPLSTAIQEITVPIPEAIANASSSYKILISFIGTGGNSRAFADDFSIPGTYNSDPSNGCLPLTSVADADNDGVADADDAYPQDQYRAYDSFYPSLNQSGTLSFEDLWPGKGDYDFNDMVVDYRIQTVTNAANQVVEVYTRITLRASGASFHNGFGFQLDGIAPGKVISVSGNSISASSIHSFAANGLESGQNFATCIVFDDFYKVMKWPGAGTGINTDRNSPFVPYVSLDTRLVFIHEGTPAPGGTLSNTELTPDKFNFFIIANQQRGREIHLADRMPTSLADISLFGTGSDDSQPAAGKYYKTRNNLPWGINVVQGFEYPVEKALVNEAYMNFIEWAASAGASFPDWFVATPGYRNTIKIY